MAITGTYNYNGLTVPGAIGEISFIHLRRAAQPTLTTFNLCIYPNETAYKDGVALCQTLYDFDSDLSLPNLWAQCYDYLETLPEFAGWQPYVPPADVQGA